jgi:nitrogen fixation NifU-like protein
MNEYQEQLLDNYHNPKNYGKPSFPYTHSAKVSNLSCGDELRVWLKVNTDNVIEDISFEGEGCSISIATASLLYELLKGKNLSFIQSLDELFAQNLIGIPLTLSRIKCATLSIESLKKLL